MGFRLHDKATSISCPIWAAPPFVGGPIIIIMGQPNVRPACEVRINGEGSFVWFFCRLIQSVHFHRITNAMSSIKRGNNMTDFHVI